MYLLSSILQIKKGKMNLKYYVRIRVIHKLFSSYTLYTFNPICLTFSFVYELPPRILQYYIMLPLMIGLILKATHYITFC